MTDTFDEIEKGHEAKYKLSEELKFKAQCRRNKRLGLWASERLGMGAEDADAYAKALVALNLEQAGVDHVVATVLADFQRLGVGIGEPEIAAAADRFYAAALESLAENYPQALADDHVQVGG